MTSIAETHRDGEREREDGTDTDDKSVRLKEGKAQKPVKQKERAAELFRRESYRRE